MNINYKGTIVEESLEDNRILNDIDIIKSGKWYMHFWNGNDVIAVFKYGVFVSNFSFE